jgi:arylsulfatase A-like enzyme
MTGPTLTTARPAGQRFAAVLDQMTFWWAAAVGTAVLHLLTARAMNLGFSVVRWGWESRDLAWRIPLGYLIVFFPVAVALGSLALVLGRSRAFQVTLWVWLTLMVFAVLLLFPELNGYASLLLAAGIAYRLTGMLKERQSAVLRWARRLGPATALIVVASSVAVPRLRAVRERATVAALPSPPAGAFNVLLVILDTVRADWLSMYGAVDSTTPKLAEWAKRGVVFEQAYSTSSWTTPSHGSLFTGQYPSVHGASFSSSLDARHTTIAEVLQQRGWATGGFTANLIATTIESGLAQGFVHYEDYQNSFEEIAKSTTISQAHNVLRFWSTLRDGRSLLAAARAFGRTDFTPRLTEDAHDDKPGSEVRESLAHWLDGLPAGRPFFAFVNFFDAHAPYRPPQPYRALFNEGKRDVDRYRGALRYLDDEVDLLLRDLERRGVLDETIVIVTSDHGEQFGEHEQSAHANSLYRQVLHVPLFVLAPRGAPAGIRVTRQVTGRDIPATILDLLAAPTDSSIAGQSLAALWRDSTATASDVVAEVDQSLRPVLRFKNSLGPLKAVFDDSLHVIRDHAGRLEVFHYRRDPTEVEDWIERGHPPEPFAQLLQRTVARHALTWPPAIPRTRGADDIEGREP